MVTKKDASGAMQAMESHLKEAEKVLRQKQKHSAS
jgi:hypothetical protein